MRASNRRVRRAIIGAGGALVLALTLSACGMKMKMDPVMMALQAPGVRTVVIPKQHSDLTIIVPPCSEAAVVQSGSKPPPGSNRLVVPKASLTQTIAVNPCMMMMMSMMMGAPGTMPISSTVLVTPGSGPAEPQSSGAGMMMMMPQDQLVLPTNSRVRTVIVPPCTMMMMGGGGKMGMMMSPPSKSKGLPAQGSDTITAPPCMAMMM